MSNPELWQHCVLVIITGSSVHAIIVSTRQLDTTHPIAPQCLYPCSSYHSRPGAWHRSTTHPVAITHRTASLLLSVFINTLLVLQYIKTITFRNHWFFWCMEPMLPGRSDKYIYNRSPSYCPQILLDSLLQEDSSIQDFLISISCACNWTCGVYLPDQPLRSIWMTCS